MSNTLPAGWTVEKQRFLWALLKDGQPRSYSLDEETAIDSVRLQPEFYDGEASKFTPDAHVDL